jgi:transcriptional regulator with XRE-family HTH domain
MPERGSRISLNYGRAIETLRRERGMTREALAAAAGVSASYLSEVERGFKRPSTDVIAKLAAAFGMLPSRLLEYVESLALAPPPVAAPSGVGGGPQGREALASRIERPTPVAARGTRDQAISALLAAAEQLSDEDLAVLLGLAQRLLGKGRVGDGHAEEADRHRRS